MAETIAEIGIKSTFLVIFIILAIAGNVLVCVAIKTNKRLRTLTNYYVLNLAIADLLFGVTGMPMILVTTIKQRWVLGPALCQISGTLNTLFVLVSIWTLALIGVNRYFAVGRATSYKHLYKKSRVLVSIAFVWVLAAFVALAPQMGWSRIKEGDNFCTIDGRTHITYSILVIMLAYVCPLVILICLYAKIFFVLREHEKAMAKMRGGSMIVRGHSEADFDTGSGDFSSTFKTEDGRFPTLPRDTGRRESALHATKDKDHCQNEDMKPNHSDELDKGREPTCSDQNDNEDVMTDDKEPEDGSTNEESCSQINQENQASNYAPEKSELDESNHVTGMHIENAPQTVSDSKVKLMFKKTRESPVASYNVGESEQKSNGETGQKRRPTRSISGLVSAVRLKRSRTSKKIKKFIMEARLTKMLFVVVAFFFICWTPLVVGTILYAFNAEPKSFNMLSMGFLIACMNSICNPIIYAFMNKLFRTTFINLFKKLGACQCLKDKR